MKKVTLALLCLLFSCKLFASHLTSAEVRYEYTGTGNVYRIYLTIASNCSGVNPATSEVVSINSTCFPSIIKQLPLVTNNIVTNYCPQFPNACSNPSGMYPAFRIVTYSDTVTLDTCANWEIVFNPCCRQSIVNNLVSPGNNNLYVAAFLNNSTAINSSPVVATPLSHFVAGNGSLNTIPMQAVDAQGDSVVYEWDIPRTSGNAPMTYTTGFSLTNPVPGSVSIDQLTQNMQIALTNIGAYQLALKIKDYRNGVLVGTTTRDFMVIGLGGSGSALTNPLLAPGSVTTYNTCPGSSNSITINFADSTATDSVFVTVTPPVIPGFTFNSVVNSAPGSATVTITWTTPGTFDPATLPSFLIGLEARDNGCPAFGLSHYSILVTTSQCVTDSVWAGDANGDFTVNVYDPLAIAVAYGESGPVRPGATLNWQAEACTDWTSSFLNGVNMKHADCNGDGQVDNSDLTAVGANWGYVHLKGTPKAKTTSVPDLYFDITGVNFVPGTTVSIPIKLGSSGNQMNGAYGIATNISVGGITLSTAPTITYTSSWLGNTSNTLNFIKSDAMNLGDLSWAYSRTNHQNVNGQGTIAHLNFTIPANAATGQQIDLDFDGTMIIDKDMNPITLFNEIDTMATIVALSVPDVEAKVAAQIVPNPSAAVASLQLIAQETTSLMVTITDITGKLVKRQSLNVSKGSTAIELPGDLESGVYLVTLSNEHSPLQTLKWIRK